MLSLLASLLFSATAVAMPAGSYDSLRAQVDDEAFSSDQIALLRTAASTNTFTPAQAAGLLETLSFGSDQLDALRVLAPRLEPGNHEVIVGVFSFSSEQDEARSILASTQPVAAAPSSAVPRPTGAVGRPTTTGRPTPPALTTSHCPVDASLPALEVNWSSAWSDAEVSSLVQSLEAESFSQPRLQLLRSRVQGRPEGLTGPQVLRILGAFDFSNDLQEVMQIVDKNLLGMTVAEVGQLIDAYTYSDGKLAALRTLKDTITDVEHKHQLLDRFTFSADKQEAARILEDVTPRSFLFGTVHSQKAVFVVDVSGSMEATFRTNQGRSLSRLDFVRCELDSVLSTQLGPTADFSVVTFSNDARAWRDSLVDATPTQVAEARGYVANMRPGGGTNIDDALRKAIRMNPDVIYFLTDGAPTAGRTRTVDGLVRIAQEGGHPVHAIAFLTGSHSGDDKSTSRQLMRGIAEATGGVYRALE